MWPVQISVLVTPCLHSVTRVTDHAKRGQGLGSHDWLWRVSLLEDEIYRNGYLRESEGIPLELDADIQ